MSRYEPKANPRYAGLGKVILFTALVAGLLAGLLVLLIGMLAPSCPFYYSMPIAFFIAFLLAYLSAAKLWPAETHRLLRLQRFRGP